mgnify:CR=1 FL=1
MKYPIQITETPHRGQTKTWTLNNAAHLFRCIEAAEKSGYSDWQQEQGRLSFVENADGDFEVVDGGAYTVEAYLDWLRHDLRALDAVEGE